VPENIQLADPLFFLEVMSVGQIKQGPKFPILQKTVLGYIVSGRCASENIRDTEKLVNLSSQEEVLESIDTTLQKFWSVVCVSCRPRPRSIYLNSSFVSNTLRKSTQRLSSGRFLVRLPFKSDPNTLGLSYEVAKRRFLSLERRLSKDPLLKKCI